MKWIGPVLVAGAFFYVLIAIWQAAVNPEILAGAAGIAILLGGFCSVLAIKNPEILKKGEIAALWICVGLFVIYGLIKAGGFL
ncbi:MAG: hypothetical protein JW931_05350 [Methanomicrobiaceae archaeon]|nr:hypothetical protein [Methanomicrobiaceae archaeon]